MNQQPNWTRTFILAVLLCALGLTAWWLEFKRKPEQEAETENSKKPFVLPKDTSITSIKLENGTRVFEWKCLDDGGKGCKIGNNSKWELEQPLKARADDTNVNSLISGLDKLIATDIFELKEETPEKRSAILKEYGLAEADLKGPHVKRVEVQTAKDGTWVGYFGNSHPINDGIFTVVEHDPAGQAMGGKPDENHVFLAPTFFKTNFEKTLTYWRDKKVFTINASEIASFRIEGKLGGGAPGTKPTWIEGEKKGADWVLRSPEGEFTGDIENIDSMLSGAAFLTAKDILDENKNSVQSKDILKGAQPLFKFTMQKAKGANDKEAPAPMTLTVYEKVEKTPGKKPAPKKSDAGTTRLFATVSDLDPLYELQNGARNQLGKTLKDLRLNKLIASTDRFGAKKLEFSGEALGPTPLTLTHQNGQWTLADGSTASEQKVSSTLDKLSGNRIQEFLPAAKSPAVEKTGTELKLWTETANGTAPKRDLIFWKSGGKLYGRDLLSNRKEVFQVDSVVLDALPTARDFFKQTAASAAPKTPQLPHQMPPNMFANPHSNQLAKPQGIPHQ